MSSFYQHLQDRMSETNKGYKHSTDGRFGTVNYKGIEQRYTRHSDTAWNGYLNDHNAGSYLDYFGGSWEMKDLEDREKEAYEKAKKEYERRESNTRQRNANTAGVAANKKAIAAQKPAAPKPKGDQQIDPVKYSPEISKAKELANNYTGNKSGATSVPGSGASSAWEQAQQISNQSAFGTQNNTDFTSQFNPSGTSDTDTHNRFNTAGKGLDDIKQGAQSFADKYKLDLIGSGKTNRLVPYEQ